MTEKQMTTKRNYHANVNTGVFCTKIVIPQLRKYFSDAELLNHVAFIMNHMDPEIMTPTIRRIITGRYIEQRTWKSVGEKVDPKRSLGYFYYWAHKAELMLHNEMNRILLTSPIQALILKERTIPEAHEILYNALNNGECTTKDVIQAHLSYISGDNGVGYAKLFCRKIHQEIAFTQKSCELYEDLMERVVDDLLSYPNSYIYVATTISKSGEDAEELRSMIAKNKVVGCIVPM